MKTKAVIDYVLTQNSRREVAEPYGVGKSSILIWLKENAVGYPSIEEFENLDMQWSGFILIDGKELKIKGKKRVILIACDALNRVPFYYRVCNSENSLEGEEFLKEVKSSLSY